MGEAETKDVGVRWLVYLNQRPPGPAGGLISKRRRRVIEEDTWPACARVHTEKNTHVHTDRERERCDSSHHTCLETFCSLWPPD